MKTTIELAREAGFETMLRKGKILGFDRDGDYTEELKAFEAFVRADEREACAQIAADYGPSRPIVSKNPSSQIVGRWEGEQAASAAIDAAIRNRGNT
jgi:hypothetical protein